MQDKNLKFPENKNFEYSLNEAYSIAVKKLSSADPAEIAGRSGAEYRGGSLYIKYLGATCRISLPDVEIAEENRENLPLREKILVLHYLLTAGGKTLTGSLITFKELPEGANYFRTYQARTLKPLTNSFGKEPGKLLDVAREMGGVKAEFGDISATVPAFPHVPITFVIWKGDSEFPPEANILFDKSITGCLPVEDIIVLCETITWKMVRMLKTIE
ncbi:MAG: DUF3786 domain-containing protein [Chloroflexota bacterium]